MLPRGRGDVSLDDKRSLYRRNSFPSSPPQRDGDRPVVAMMTNKVALVTGSTSGIGLGIVEHFASLGARVVIHGRDEAQAREIAERLRLEGHDAAAVAGDVAEVEACRRIVRFTVEQFGGIDVLVNNAANTSRGYLEDAPVELWDTIMHVNLRAPFLCLQEAVKSMKARGGGSIVNIGSVNAYIGEPKLGPYSVSKGGLMTLTRNAAATLNRYRIRVNQINVGWTLTEGEDRVKRLEGTWSELAREGGGDASVRTAAVAAGRGDCRRLFRVRRQRARDRHGHGPRAVSSRRAAQLVNFMPPRISLFPKCYFDDFTEGRRSYVDWIRDAATLGGEGIEHYDGFFRSLAPADVDPIARAMEETGQITSMICFSPDFTHPDADERRRQVDRQKAAIDLTVRLGARHCRTLSGQRYPGMSRQEGIERTIEGIRRSLDYAGERDVVLCMENHYKDGTWRYPSSRSRRTFSWRSSSDRLAATSASSTIRRMPWSAASIRSRFLEKVKHRVVTMHASDRYLAPGATLDDLTDGRRRDRLCVGVEAWRNRHRNERLRRDLSHPVGGRLQRLDLNRGWHGRTRRDRAFGRVPQTASAPEYFGSADRMSSVASAHPDASRARRARADARAASDRQRRRHRVAAGADRRDRRRRHRGAQHGVHVHGAALEADRRPDPEHCERSIAGEPLAPAEIEQKLARRFRLLGTQGLVGMALAAIDMALWDALARSHETSLVRLLGGAPKGRSRPTARSATTASPRVGRGGRGVGRARLHGRQGQDRLSHGAGGSSRSSAPSGRRSARRGDHGGLQPVPDASRGRAAPARPRRRRARRGSRSRPSPTTTPGTPRSRARPRRRSSAARTGGASLDLQHAIDARASDLRDARRDEDRRRDRLAARRGAGPRPRHPGVEPPVAGDQRAAAVLTPTAHWLEYADWWNPIVARAAANQRRDDERCRTRRGTGVEWNEQAVEKFLVRG